MNRQEKLWAGEFGDAYHKRCVKLAPRRNIWLRIAGHRPGGSDLPITYNIDSALEFGCGNRENLKAIESIKSDITTTGVDINPTVEPDYLASLLDPPDITADLVITCGLLIHIHPDDIWTAYDNLTAATNKYLCVMEYYNPTVVEATYRGLGETLWKRDFAGDLLDHYPFKLIDYGFEYHREGVLDDITWFLLEKKACAGAAT